MWPSSLFTLPALTVFVSERQSFSQAKDDLSAVEQRLRNIDREKENLQKLVREGNKKNQDLRDEISELREKLLNIENRHKRELESERQKVGPFSNPLKSDILLGLLHVA